MKLGTIQQLHGTGKSLFVVKPNELGSSIVIIDEQQSFFTIDDIGIEFEYELVDIGHKMYKKGHYQPFIVANILIYQED